MDPGSSRDDTEYVEAVVHVCEAVTAATRCWRQGIRTQIPLRGRDLMAIA